MKKIIIALLLALTVSNIVKTEESNALSISGAIETIANMENSGTDDSLDTFIKDLGSAKLYLHNIFYSAPSVQMMGLSEAYIQTVDGETKIYKTDGGTVSYGKILITQSNATSENLTIPKKSTANGYLLFTGPLYLKIKQNSSEANIDGGGDTYFNSNSDMPLGLSGYQGTWPDDNDLYLQVYAK